MGRHCLAGEHESSRRLKTEILTQMEGVDAATAERRIVLVAATNRPEVPHSLAFPPPPPLYICERYRSVAMHQNVSKKFNAKALLHCRCCD